MGSVAITCNFSWLELLIRFDGKWDHDLELMVEMAEWNWLYGIYLRPWTASFLEQFDENLDGNYDGNLMLTWVGIWWEWTWSFSWTVCGLRLPWTGAENGCHWVTYTFYTLSGTNMKKVGMRHLHLNWCKKRWIESQTPWGANMQTSWYNQSIHIFKTNLAITSLDHIIDAIIWEERWSNGVEKCEGDWGARPRQGKAFFSEQATIKEGKSFLSKQAKIMF